MPENRESGSTLDAKYEAENQEMLEVYGPQAVHVVRNAEDGKVLTAVGVFRDGTKDILHHTSLRGRVRARTHVSSSRRGEIRFRADDRNLRD